MIDYKGYVKKCNHTIEGIALSLKYSLRQMKRYLSHETLLPDKKVIDMACLLGPNAAAMIFEHMAHCNDIGKRFLPAPLNNIERTFTAFCFKAPEEQEEMLNAIREMCRIVLNNRPMSSTEAEQFDLKFLEVLDVEQLCLEIKIEYARVRGIEALETRLIEHRQKVIDRGYHIEKEKPLAPVAAERRAVMSF